MRVTVNVVQAEAAWAGEAMSRGLVEELGEGVHGVPALRREEQGTVVWFDTPDGASNPVPWQPGYDPDDTTGHDPDRTAGHDSRARITVAHLAN